MGNNLKKVRFLGRVGPRRRFFPSHPRPNFRGSRGHMCLYERRGGSTQLQSLPLQEKSVGRMGNGRRSGIGHGGIGHGGICEGAGAADSYRSPTRGRASLGWRP